MAEPIVTTPLIPNPATRRYHEQRILPIRMRLLTFRKRVLLSALRPTPYALPHFVCGTRLLIKYICSYPAHLEAVCSTATRGHAMPW